MIVNIADIPINITINNNKEIRYYLHKQFGKFIIKKKSYRYKINLIGKSTQDNNFKISFENGYSATIQTPENLENILMLNVFLKIAFSVPLIKNKGLLVHGSSLLKGNKGYIFVGKEGIGKSTIVKLAKNYPSYNDDYAIIRSLGGVYYLYPSPFQETNPHLGSGAKVILNKIFFLKQAKKTRLNNIKDIKSSLLILSNLISPLYLNLQVSQLNKQIFTFILKSSSILTSKVKCYNLLFAENTDFLNYL